MAKEKGPKCVLKWNYKILVNIGRLLPVPLSFLVAPFFFQNDHFIFLQK